MENSRPEERIEMVRKTTHPLVSVILPCYNGEEFLPGAIRSVMSQSVQDWEVIVVDDGSTDGSRQTLAPYLRDSRIRLIEHGWNRGIPHTKNTGIEAARGQYIAFLDQDDIWIRNKLEMQVARFLSEEEDVGILCTGMVFVDMDSNIMDLFYGFRDESQEEVLKDLFLKPMNSSSVMMIRKEVFSAVGPLNTDLTGWDDYEFLMRAATRFRLKYVRGPLVIKTVHTQNAQNEASVRHERELVFERVVKMHPFLGQYKGMRDAMAFCRDARSSLEVCDRVHARDSLRRSIDRNPGYMRSRVFYLLSLLPGDILIPLMDVQSRLSRMVNRRLATSALRSWPFAPFVYEELSQRPWGVRIL